MSTCPRRLGLGLQQRRHWFSRRVSSARQPFHGRLKWQGINACEESRPHPFISQLNVPPPLCFDYGGCTAEHFEGKS